MEPILFNELPRWSKRFVTLAEHISEWSKDKSTKVGAVIVDDMNRVVSLGYNGFPRHVKESYMERHERPQKYLWTEHAERNAIYNARVSLVNTDLYCTFFPCASCTRAIIQTGIFRVTTPMPSKESKERWGDDFEISMLMLQEVGIELRLYIR